MKTKQPHSCETEVFFKIRNLHKKFGRHTALKKINLDVYCGEVLVVMGRSGGGKSVLLKHLTGLLRPTSGEVKIKEQTISHLTERQLNSIRSKIGIVFQNAALFDSMTLGENAAFPLYERGIKDKEVIYQKVVEALKTVGLEKHLNKMPVELSGGMKKRASIARAIITEPECILYDEPTAELDPIAADSINHLIKHLQEDLKVTSVVVSHDMKSIFQIANRIAYLHKGSVYFCGEKEAVRQSSDPIIKDFIEGVSRGIMEFGGE